MYLGLPEAARKKVRLGARGPYYKGWSLEEAWDNTRPDAGALFNACPYKGVGYIRALRGSSWKDIHRCVRELLEARGE